MKKGILSPRTIFVSAAVIAAALTRFIPHPPNFTEIGAMALFAGACMPRRWMSLLIPMAVMLVTDLKWGFHNTMWAVYLSFGLITMIGWLISKRQNVLSIAGASLAAALLFFFITNAAVWVMDVNGPVATQMYPSSFAGLTAAIAAGIPFFGNTLVSQLLYGTLLFGAYHASRTWKPSLVKA